MKKIIFIIFSITNILTAQSIKKGNYVFIRSDADYPLLKKKIPTEEILKGYRIKVDSIDTINVHYKYIDFTTSQGIVLKKYENLLRSMSISDFKKMTQPFYPKFKGFSVGGLSIPIRLRGKDETFTFDNDLSLGVNLLMGWGKDTSASSWLDLSLGLSITKINLTKDNCKNLTESRSASALTFSVGGIMKLNQLTKNPYIDTNPINVGFFMGFDSLGANDLNVDWQYNKQLWIGVGINIGISPSVTNDGK